MQELLQSDDFRSIVLNNTPLIDVRAPVEFEKGAFPNSVNLPLMNNEERHLIGIKYKNEGNKEAVKLGHSLVSGKVKKDRIQAWLDFKQNNPDAMLYCFRGGQRSKISQEWIAENDQQITRLKGGYKAFRTYLMQEIENSVKMFKPIILGGHTGSGKTILLNNIKNSIDLEGLANHRGSSFGRKVTPQPTQINFENALAYELIQKLEAGYENLLFEDEGKYVGSAYIPNNFALYLAQAPLLILKTPIEERVEITFDEYITKAHQEYAAAFGLEYLQLWYEDMHNAMKRISRRMGLERYAHVCKLFDIAYEQQKRDNDKILYKEWIHYLLSEYYDPMYEYQIKNNAKRIVFEGNKEEIEAYLNANII
jgi:tRNA 2-selenouridine synthase